jgi:hypothetical protein
LKYSAGSGRLGPHIAEISTRKNQHMKTIFKTNSYSGSADADRSVARQFPLIDVNFYGETRGSSLEVPPYRAELRRFRNLSRDFWGKETPRDYAREITLFGLIVGVSAWPIVSMVRALLHLVK